MPIITTTILNNDITIIRPITHQILEDVVGALSLPANIRVMVTGNSQDDEEVPIELVSEPHADFKRSSKMIVTVNQQYNPEARYKDQLLVGSHECLFLDNDIKFRLEPSYKEVELKFNIRMTFENKELANMARNTMSNLVAMGRGNLTHMVDYKYLLPEATLVLMSHMHTLRESNHGLGETFKDYFLRCKSDVLVVEADNSNSNKSFIVKESQSRITGNMIIDGMIEESAKNTSIDKHELSMTYTVIVKLPTDVLVKYPQIVHGQFIDEAYMLPTTKYPISIHDDRYSHLEKAFDTFNNVDDYAPWNDGIPIPEYYDWHPKSKLNTVAGVLKIAITIDTNDAADLINLTELGDISLKPEIIEYLKANHQYINIPGEAMFYLALYKDDEFFSSSALDIDADLNVRYQVDLDPRKNYTLYLCIVTDYQSLTSRVVKSLLDNYNLYVQFLQATHSEFISDYGIIPEPIDGDSVSKDEFDTIAYMINRYKYSSNPKYHYGIKNVCNLIIIGG